MLNALCNNGMGVISWMIVFIPFIMMTVITTLLLFVFGLSPASGGLNYKVDYPQAQNSNKNVIIKKTGDKSRDEYNPNDYTSGTPDDINHYN